MPQNYLQAEPIRMKGNPEFSEKWVQELIAGDPSILGLGDLECLKQEKPQPRAGRLDMLLQDVEGKKRYEVELQLGATDESHIIRAIEYWDIERRRYRKYDHCAVIIAEEITNRFFNVIELINRAIPFIAIQVRAVKVGEHTTLVFTTILDDRPWAAADEDDDRSAPTNREYWEKKAGETIKMADQLHKISRECYGGDDLDLNYTKSYIGLFKGGAPFNFIRLAPRKKYITLSIVLPRSEETDATIEEAGFDTLDYDSKWNRYRINLDKSDIKNKEDVIKVLIQAAYERYVG